MATPEKLPPQNIEAEASIIGAMLFDNAIVSYVVSKLKPHYFYSERHRKVFEVICELFDQNQPADIITLSEQLKKVGEYDAVGGSEFLAQLANSVETSANVEEYMRIVREKALLRVLISNASQIVQDALKADVDLNEILDRSERAIFDITKDNLESKEVPFKDVVKNCIERIDQLYQNKEQITGTATGFADFDRLTSGLQKSDLIIVAGRPSMGKSAFASCICEHVAVDLGKPVAIFSLEMSIGQITTRMLCSHARVDAQRIRNGFLAQTDWPKLISAAGKLGEAPIYIDDSPGISVFELRAKARRLKLEHDVQLIVVDYLQLMQGAARAENRQQEISDISRKLKALAREIEVPVIAISQLSRAVESRQGNRPQLSDLRESGSLEQDADVVVLLFREEYYNRTEDNAGKATAIVAKQRNGPVGDCNLVFIKEFTRFETLSTRDYDVIY
ncbi:MAG: replicative DNA helicase [Candidatus Omnitrophica bacterium]|nr:replicative DNA helicase [Candidatus Omnitrophota bacterium]